MILVSISSSEDKFVIKLNHKINFVIEKEFGRIKSITKRTNFVVVQLFFATAKLLYKEIFVRLNK